MTKKDKHQHAHGEPATPATEASQTPQGTAGGAAVVELPAEAVVRLEREQAELQDRYLRLAAEFENYKKRMGRERAETWSRAQADVVQRLVDAVDDLSRFAHVDPTTTDAQTIHDGVELVERKILKELEVLGVRRLDETGVPFDPAVHEAVTVGPALTPEQDNMVGQILQAGYRLGGQLLRPARVQVLKWQEPGQPATGNGEGREER
jgi:molecular chaperone GrpE